LEDSLESEAMQWENEYLCRSLDVGVERRRERKGLDGKNERDKIDAKGNESDSDDKGCLIFSKSVTIITGKQITTTCFSSRINTCLTQF